jgi:diaminopimelate epimerase
MPFTFMKMHGLGNDFVVIDATANPFVWPREKIIALGHRHTGVGFDQLLVVESAPSQEFDFVYRIFNADGTEVEQCGNGARCVARYLHEMGLTHKAEIRLASLAGVLQVKLEPDGQVTVNMGVPNFNPQAIPLRMPTQQLQYEVDIAGNHCKFAAVSLGNPHAVIQVADIDQAPVTSWGPLLQQHAVFPKQVNVGFLQIVTRKFIRLRIFERGVGETQACGSGACAAVAVGRLQNLLDKEVTVALPGGQLFIKWDSLQDSISMTGAAQPVFIGKFIADS